MKLSYITRLSRFVLMIFAIILACQKDPLIDALKPQISLLQMEYNQSKLRLDRLKAENTELKQKLSSLQESYALLQKQYQDELSASEVLQNEINDVEKQLQTAIESHNLKRSMLLTELDELKEKTENNSEELKQHQENQKLIDEVTKTIHQNEQSQSALQELQRKIAVFQSGLKEHMLQKKQYEDLESEHVSKLDEISQLEEQIKKAEDTLEKLRLDAEINQLEQQLSKEKVTNELIEKVENDLADLNQEIKKLSAFADLLPKLQESLSETIENEKKLRLQLGDLKHEFDVLTGDPPNPPPVMNGPAIQVDHDMPKRLFIGDVFQLNYSFFNEEGVQTQPTGLVLWSSDNEKIIEINEVSGEVQAMSLGTAEISITTQINDQIYEDTLTINVSRLLQQRVEIVENIPRVFMPLQNHQLELAYFNERDEKVSQPQGEVTWESSDSQIIRVNPNTGEITALKSGSATIKVTLEHPENGVMTFSYTIQVQTDSIQPRLVIHNKPNNSRININETYDLNFEYYNSSGQKVEPPSGFIVVWNSTDTTKVDINPITGVVRGVALGTSSISVSTVIEGEIISDQFSLTVSSDSVPSNGHRIEIIEDDFPDPFLVGQTHRFTVHFFDSDGNQITAPSGTAVWKSSKNRNARPNSDNSGDVTAERKGNATITVTFTISSNSQVLTDTYDITVEQGPAIRIIENLPSNFTPPQKHTLTYNYWNANGAKVDPPDGIRWKSATKSVATIDNSTGEVTAVGAGTSVITITTQEKNKDNRIDDTYEITVIGGDPPTIEPELRMIDLPTNSTITINGTQDLDFEYYDNTGTKANLPQGATVTWTSSDTTKITIDATTGVITGVAAGTSDITASATIDGSTITATETITVSAGSLRNDGSYITIQEDLPQLFFVGQTHMFAIKHYDSSDTEIAQPAGSAEWTASNSGMTFSTTTIGQGTAATAGTITITVRYTFDSDGNYLEDTYEIEVLQGPLVRIVEDIPEGFKKGQTHTLTADYYNSSGQKVTHPDGLTWTSRNADVATINRDSGLLTAVGPGTVTVVARTKGSTPRQSDTYAFTVLADSELKIIDLPPSSSITLSTSHDLNFEFYNSSGTKVNLPPGATVSWTSSDVSKVSVVSGTGVITGTGIGEADITASTTIDGAPITTKATISVVAGSIRTDGSRIEILDDLPDPFLVGQTHTFSIKYYDSTNAEITPLPAGSYEWTTSNNRITFSSSNSGVGVAAGAKVVTITVRYIFNSDGSYLEATYRLKVIQGPLVQITEDIPEGFKKGQTHPLAAEYYNATGNKVDYPGTGGLIWSSSDETVATVDSSTGEVTAVGPGTVTITVKTQEFGTNSREEEKDAYEFTVLTDPKLVIVDLPASSTIASNGTHDLNFEYYDNTGTKVDLPQGATFTWTSSDTTKITIDASTGVITSVSAGNSDITISATISGSTITATENIIVSASSLRNDGTYITIQEDLTRLFFVGQMRQFTIKHYNSSDTEIAEPAGSAVWTDSNSGITFSTTTIGQGTAAAAGSTTITVRYTFDSDGNYLEDT
ncbi:MAG: Ig-like domain-containing protein, partial [Flavobacteriaceae bacterium]|nr:Ig-like domain-containing protein [Flavobacteriaceae bacterium]